MALTEGDKAIIAQIAEGIIERVLEKHIETCPHGISFKSSKKMIAAIIVGVVLGSGIVNGVSVFAAVKLLMGI